jgi:hypothetical protein
MLDPILEANRRHVRQQIEAFYPQYRHLLKYCSDEISAIPSGTDGRDLDMALFRIEQKLDSDNREALNKVLIEANNPEESSDDRRKRLDSLWEQINDSGMSKLARHVAYRREVIEFLEDQIGSALCQNPRVYATSLTTA